MSFPKKTLKVCDCGHEAEVSCEKLGEQPNHSYKFTAKIGDTVYEHTMTVGPVDGPIVQPTLEQLQKDVDAAREHAAKHCHMRHTVKELESKIV